MEKEIVLSNIINMSISDLVKKLSYAYCKLIDSSLPFTMMPSVMLWGPPGVGKSQAIREIASVIEEKTNKRVEVADVRLLLFNPVDLRGIPTANEDKTLAVWLKPKIFQMDASDDVVNILFLDEISAASQSVQAAAYQITLDRVIGEHKLPDNCIVMAAGNRVTDKSVAFKMPKALANRLMHIEVSLDFISWRNWANNTGVNAKVIDYLEHHRDKLMNFDPSTDNLSFATPRSWEMVSNILNSVEDDPDKMYSLIAGIVGVDLAVDLMAWNRSAHDQTSIQNIFEGKETNVPTDPSKLYALVKAMAVYAMERPEEKDKILNSIIYAKNLPPEFSMMLIREYMKFDADILNAMIDVPDVKELIDSNVGMLYG